MARDVTEYRMYAQIQRQPEELARLLGAPEPVEEAAALLSGVEHVFTVGIGTSSNAAQTAASFLRAGGVDAAAWSSYDFALYGPGLRGGAAMVFSHSGRKEASRRALERAKEAHLPSIWITGQESEPNPATVTLRTVAPETSAAHTVSYTAAMLMAARVVERVQPGSLGDLSAVPEAVREALGLEASASALAAEWAEAGAIVAVGAGPQEGSAHEVAIKINEAARRRARGYAVEQFLHGPQAQMQPGDALLCYGAAGRGLERTRVVAQFGLDIDAPVAWVAPVAGPAGVAPLRVPDVGEWLAPIVQAVPGQLLAAHLAARSDVDADSFRRDEQGFRQAYERYAL